MAESFAQAHHIANNCQNWNSIAGLGTHNLVVFLPYFAIAKQFVLCKIHRKKKKGEASLIDSTCSIFVSLTLSTMSGMRHRLVNSC